MKNIMFFFMFWVLFVFFVLLIHLFDVNEVIKCPLITFDVAFSLLAAFFFFKLFSEKLRKRNVTKAL
jgi:hypothetical protein